jgi:hypothetical protein
MEPVCSLPLSQVPVTCRYSEPDKSMYQWSSKPEALWNVSQYLQVGYFSILPSHKDHSLSAVHDSLFNIFTAIVTLEAVPPSATWGRTMPRGQVITYGLYRYCRTVWFGRWVPTKWGHFSAIHGVTPHTTVIYIDTAVTHHIHSHGSVFHCTEWIKWKYHIHIKCFLRDKQKVTVSAPVCEHYRRPLCSPP